MMVLFNQLMCIFQASQVVLVVKNPSANAGDIIDASSVPRLGRSFGEGHGNPLQYSCLENPINRGARQATLYRVTKSQTRLKWLSMRVHFSVWKRTIMNPARRLPYAMGCIMKNWVVFTVSVQFSRSVMSDSRQPHESQHTRPPCLSPTPGVYPDSCPSSRWCHPTISSSVVLFSSCLQSFPASGSFPRSQFGTNTTDWAT